MPVFLCPSNLRGVFAKMRFPPVCQRRVMNLPTSGICRPRNFLLFASITMLSACATPELTKAPQAPTFTANHWSASAPLSSVENGWITKFQQPALERQVESAVERNFSLEAAAARVNAALAQAQIGGAVTRPNASLSLDAKRSHSAIPMASTSNQFSLSLNLGWEADLWGRLSHRARVSAENAEAQLAEYKAARLSLVANVARSWFSSIEARQQETLAQEQVENFERTLEIISERYRSGTGSALDVHLARENLASARVSLLVRQRQTDSSARALQTLSGSYPGGELLLPKQLPSLESPIPAGLPAELLSRRPDLVAAKHRLLASLNNRLEKQNNYLPTIRLNAGGGNLSGEFHKLLNWDQLFWSLAAQIVQPLYQGGGLKGERALASAQEQEALANYTAAVLTAFQEVETALAAQPLLLKQWQAQQLADEEARQSAELALEQYRAGLVDITTLLDSQRRAFNARSALLNAQLARLENRIDLHLALGGDFSMPPPKRLNDLAPTPANTP